MDKREIDEQLKTLAFDMDDEINARNKRLGHRSTPPSHLYRPMDPSHAIIFATIVIVGGLWGGKLLYDYIQEQHMMAAFNEAGSFQEESVLPFLQAQPQWRLSFHKQSVIFHAH